MRVCVQVRIRTEKARTVNSSDGGSDYSGNPLLDDLEDGTGAVCITHPRL